jgi:hypothetical protein
MVTFRVWTGANGFYEVADESGATVLTLPFSEAVEPDLPSQEV